MKQVIIENPIVNSPNDEPLRHFKFTDDGITDNVVESRPVNQYFLPNGEHRFRLGIHSISR